MRASARRRTSSDARVLLLRYFFLQNQVFPESHSKRLGTLLPLHLPFKIGDCVITAVLNTTAEADLISDGKTK